MFSGLKGATAIISGAGGGMGTAAALRLAKEHCKIFAVDLCPGALKKLEERFQQEHLDGLITFLTTFSHIL